MSNLTLAPETARRFLTALGYDLEQPTGLELRLIGNGKPQILWPEPGRQVWPQVEAANKAGANVYFSACPRRDRQGDAAHTTHAPALWADLDGKAYDPADHQHGKALALERLRHDLPPELQPSILVDSGNGYHAYWLLVEPWTFSENGDRLKFEAVLRALAEYLDSDTDVADAARVMRLPGTLNVKKPANPLPCLLLECDPGRRFNPSDFDPYFTPAPVCQEPTPTPSLPTGERRKLARATVDFLAFGAPEGERQVRAFKAACDLAGCGYPQNEALALVLDAARKCGLPEDEAQHAVESAYSKDRKPARSAEPLPEPEANPETKAKPSAGIDEAQARYVVENGRICAVAYDRSGGRALVPLCNFTAQIREEIARDDGQETTRVFGIEGRLDTGEPLPRAQVDGTRFASMSWVTANWGVRAIVRAGQATTDKLREAIQLLSQDASTRHVYTHTGWREIGGRWVYLTAGGALGLDGVEVSLDEKLQRYRLPLQPTQAREGMAASLRFLDIAPASVTYPVWAAMYLAPLTPILTPDFVPWAYGPTGSLKSTVLALALCHYGTFTRNTLPASWEATENFLEKLTFLAADAPLCIDDFAPMATHHDAQQMERNAVRIVRAAGNRSGRGRLRSDLAFRPTYSPRGVVLSTGEQLPNGTSVLARIAGIEFAAGSVNLDDLTRAQTEAGLYPQAMAGYILWLRDQWEHLTTTLPVTWQNLRGRVVGAAHLRVPEFFATLYLALDTGLSFAVETKAITQAEADERREQGEAALVELAKAQGERVKGERPTLRFLSVLRELLAQNKVYLKPCESDHMLGECLGWQDKDYLYLLSAATYNRVAKFCRDEGGYFPVKANTLHKMLAEEGYIEVAADGFLAQVWRDNRNQRVLKMPRKAANL